MSALRPAVPASVRASCSASDRLRLALLSSGIALGLALCPAERATAAETLLGGLDYPWDIETDGGAVYITEKPGTLGILENGSFRRLAVETSEPILDSRGGGLMGLALLPDFSESRRAVLYHHAGTPEARSNRVIEVELAGDVWRETRVLIDAIPGHPLYNGGRVAFGPDGMLYVTTGWIENRALPQDPGSLAGKILRITPDGGIPAGNPFAGSPVWSLGHRNPQGLAWDDAGQLYAAEHGQSGHDEVNRIVPGGNYGWPAIQGSEAAPGMIRPVAHSGHGTWAPSGLAWNRDHLLVAGLRTGSLLAVTPEGTVREAHAAGERLRDVLVTPDGLLAVTTARSPRRDGPSGDRLIRISP